ncbi:MULTISPECIES: SusC/RagA family TonB-linked outer membrane protein [Niastella]|uniref:SusC/RagA family TonB-linked outer membrane protein n=1 Tax=Niastella soli TaxID=2821487 RepID=A0ABS3YVA8_9BACT|nr:SusC/RagA family TonB-linked outer membrane protein [Niastella soli]MBO9201859.1 SusC/RagA family TonB-linked outer membrane protein [Niastella soli]
MRSTTALKSRAIVLPLLFLSNLLFLTPTHAQQKNSTVTGVVSNEKNQPLVHVTVVARNTKTNFAAGASSDTAGVFTFTNLPAGGPYNFTFTGVGYQSQDLNGYTLKEGASLSLVVTMHEFESTLDQVVVVGYGTRKRSEVTSSIVSIDAGDIKSRPVQNTLQALQGKAAGIDITSNERPGEVGKVSIRGTRSLANTTVLERINDPLYVVDGVPLNFGSIASVNPNDIETVDVLKDASATAIYGSRGANGVILITTKKGKNGQFSLNYVGTVAVEDIKDRQEMMNSAQYIDFRRDAYRRVKYLGGTGTSYPDDPTIAADKTIFGADPIAYGNVLRGWANGSWDGSLVPTTDWRSMVKQTGVTHDHIISVAGGSQKVRAYASFGYLKQDGTQLGQDFTRYSSKFNIEVNPVKWFTMGTSITTSYGLQNYGFATAANITGPGSLYAAAQGMLPYAVPFDTATGKRINLPGGDININNPIGEDKYNINLRKTLRAMGAFHIELNPIAGLRYRVTFGPDYNNYYNGRYMDSMSIQRGSGQSGSSNYAQLAQTNNFSWTLDHLLTYNKTIGGEHNVGASFLYSATQVRDENSSMTATKLPWASQKWYALNSVTALDAYSSSLSERSLLSYMGRITYSYRGKYYFDAFTRWDGASQLAPGHKWDVFPAASAAWRVSEEPFMKEVSWVDNLKIRLGFGTVGNAAINPYTTVGTAQPLYYTWGNVVDFGFVSSDPSAATPISMPNPQLKWERTTQEDLGIEFRLFRGRVDGAIDLYSSRTRDLLMLRTIPSAVGYTQSLDNIGLTGNKGLEITLNTINMQQGDFTWSSTINFSTNRDRIIETANGKVDDVTNAWFPGQRIQSIYDYEKAGIWQEGDKDELALFNAKLPAASQFKPGMIKVKDQNGDYLIDANHDRKVVGNLQPRWNGGLSNEFTYRNWGLNIFIFSRWGYFIQTGAESLQGRFAQRVLNYWTPGNPTNDYPAPNFGNAAGDAYRSSMNYQDGSFVKIRNITLSYTMPGNVMSKLKMKNCRLYGQLMNPGLIYSKISWIEPDLGVSAYNKGFVIGVNAGF